MASIEKRGTNSWRLIVEVGYDSIGKRIKRTKTVRVEDQALLRTTKRLREYLEDELHKFKIEVEAGEHFTPQKMTLDQFIQDEWIPKYASKTENLSPLTYKIYMHHIKKHIIPTFGHKNLGDIKPIHIVTFINDISKGGTLSAATIQYIHRVFKNILCRATEWQVIKSNPIIGIKKPKAEQIEHDFYDENEAREVIKALYQEPRRWRLLILGAMIGGCRRGELVGLEWSDINFENKTISIRKSISLTSESKAIETGPKTKSSIRTIDMPDWYMEELFFNKNFIII